MDENKPISESKKGTNLRETKKGTKGTGLTDSDKLLEKQDEAKKAARASALPADITGVKSIANANKTDAKKIAAAKPAGEKSISKKTAGDNIITEIINISDDNSLDDSLDDNLDTAYDLNGIAISKNAKKHSIKKSKKEKILLFDRHDGSHGELSTKQQEVLRYIKQQIIEKGYPPSVREICTAVNLRSTSSVHSHLATLERLGYIKKNPTKPRAIEITDSSFNTLRKDTVTLPVIGRVAAGLPILATENIESYFAISTEFLPKGKDTFMLSVKGDSMCEAGILDGDLIIVEKQEAAENGDIIVALIDDSATVKRFFKEETHIRLQPENSSMEPIIVSDVKILGKVVGLFRYNI